MTASTPLCHKRRDIRPRAIVANLVGSGATTRALIAIRYEQRVALLAEVTRVAAARVLAFCQTQPTAAPA